MGQIFLNVAKLIRQDLAFRATPIICASDEHLLRVVAHENCKDQMTVVPDIDCTFKSDSCLSTEMDQI
jgi:hypothetical protein